MTSTLNYPDVVTDSYRPSIEGWLSDGVNDIKIDVDTQIGYLKAQMRDGRYLTSTAIDHFMTTGEGKEFISALMGEKARRLFPVGTETRMENHPDRSMAENQLRNHVGHSVRVTREAYMETAGWGWCVQAHDTQEGCYGGTWTVPICNLVTPAVAQDKTEAFTPAVAQGNTEAFTPGQRLTVTINNPSGAPLATGTEVTLVRVEQNGTHVVSDRPDSEWYVGKDALKAATPEAPAAVQEISEVERLKAEVRAAEAKHQADIDLIGETLMQEARDRSWCSEYDTVINALNQYLNRPLPDREREYEVLVTGTVEVPFAYTVTVSAGPDDDIDDAAREEFDNQGVSARDLVTHYADLYSADISVEDTEVQ